MKALKIVASSHEHRWRTGSGRAAAGLMTDDKHSKAGTGSVAGASDGKLHGRSARRRCSGRGMEASAGAQEALGGGWRMQRDGGTDGIAAAGLHVDPNRQVEKRIHAGPAASTATAVASWGQTSENGACEPCTKELHPPCDYAGLAIFQLLNTAFAPASGLVPISARFGTRCSLYITPRSVAC